MGRGSGWRRRHCRLAEAPKTHDSKHYNSKEKHGEEEKKMASSPKRRRRTPIHPQASTMNNSYSLGF
jgi:hypothetical protein